MCSSDLGKVPLEHVPIELAAIAERTASDLEAVAAKRGTTIAVEAAPALAMGDEARVGQIARVLVDNAIRHNPEGVAIVVATGADATTAWVEVRDSGPRIADAEVGAIFTRFARGSGAGEGSGLGLAIASELAVRMGGRLLLDQDGTRKAFRLELAADRG